jgi:hypothetical protein
MCFSYLGLYHPHTPKSRICLGRGGTGESGEGLAPPVSLRRVDPDYPPAEWEEPYGFEARLHAVCFEGAHGVPVRVTPARDT